jgi:AraC-like DNA-binding protein
MGQAAVPRTLFSTDGLTGHEGWEAWRDVLAPLFDIREENAPDRFRAEIDAFDLNRMIVARIAFSGIQQTGFRSPELIRRSGLDHYAIELCLENDGYLCEGRGGVSEIGAGSIAVLDLGQANTLTSANSDSIALTIPRAIIERRCPDIERLHATRVGGTGLSRLLADHMLSLYRHLPEMSEAEADSAAEATIALVSACLAPSAQRLADASDAIDRTLLDRARRYIEARLEDPRLTPTAVCAAAGVSRSGLYRLFGHWGGVARYIQERRLRRAQASLRDPAERRNISELAYSHGFTSAAHFSRAFRALFGCSPRDARDCARARVMPVPPESIAATSVDDWLRKLQSH